MRTALLGVLTLALACLGPGVALATPDSGVEFPEGPGVGVPPATGGGSLTTLFAQNNNFAGNAFDIVAQTDLTVVSFDINLDSIGQPYTIEVWTRPGTANGNEQNAGWAMLGSAVVVGNGIDVPTPLPVGGLAMTSGQTTGVIISCVQCVTGVGGFHYTNGGPNIYSNADLDIITYSGISPFPPASVFFPRQWNGTVYYDFDPISVEERSWGSIKVGYR
jgi:hypothetical protein